MNDRLKKTAPYVTKTGKMLGENEIAGYVEEAERGYDVSRPDDPLRLRRWDTSQKFLLEHGELKVDAESALYKQGVRWEMHPANFRYACYVEAAHSLIAQAEAHTRLLDLLRPYRVGGVFVFDVRVVCLGEPKPTGEPSRTWIGFYRPDPGDAPGVCWKWGCYVCPQTGMHIATKQQAIEQAESHVCDEQEPK